ncbi:MAG TPA: MotA/TolQ/ExbB proton channel family protein [Methylibium sp.]|uniref:MotA/TolQ/ExbB proton channel family protein n=1 Tax=Methylibium sp. TaxID=2067992 RepID=UPI002DBAE435|nr:MotA/TolQ/ExbB proton channel family protein [Methylibium sp.]HEU4460411.1 MotA/TolQ/ExbB proton channel family protein [Methylibium sp.]
MDGLGELWRAGDAVTRGVAAMLLTMSVAAWVLIVWKGWLLGRVRRDLARAIPVFWSASDVATARAQLVAFDREATLQPLVDAGLQEARGGTLEAAAQRGSQLTRRLRDALHRVLAQLRFGQVALASIGATAPFIGLFGTVWSIYHALLGLAGGGSFGIERIAAPVGEALVMTAAGLAVAIPAVLAYNVFGQQVGACEAELEGFAHDLREMLLDAQAAAGGSPLARLDPAG